MNDTVIHGDALSVLRGMADNSVDAIVSDPPAGINFMNKPFDDDRGGRDQWVAWLKEIMIEAKRVIRPGGHALIWALPRTSHWTATALEDAGFEVRDKLYHLFGSGFPKSTAIDKQIDKMLGKEREVIGVLPSSRSKPSDSGFMMAQKLETKPATPEAAQYAGYGTALKPSCEEWILCRKPLAESSIAAQVLATGTGGLNIGQCRVGNEQRTNKGMSSLGVMHDDNWQPKEVESVTQGRFPSHLLLSHSLWCVPRGTKRVRVNDKEHNRHNGARIDRTIYGDYNANVTTGYADLEGYEHVEAYDCAPDCPIAELDRQSGVRSRKASASGLGGLKTQYIGGHIEKHYQSAQYHDEGSVARYFTNFPPDDYTPYGSTGLQSVPCCLLCGKENDIMDETKSKESTISCNTIVSTAEKNSRPGALPLNTAPRNAQERQQPESEGKSQRHSTPASNAESNGWNTQATIEPFAQSSAWDLPIRKIAQLVKSAANLCDSCAIAIAQSLVQLKLKQDHPLPLGLLSITEISANILYQNLVWYVAALESTDTTPTIANLTRLFGFVLHAINDTTMQAQLEVNASDLIPYRYQSKASRAERNAGCEDLPLHDAGVKNASGRGFSETDPYKEIKASNHHPTVKPLALMRWLIRLITPPDGIVLDPFCGSGSTLVACVQEQKHFIGIEQDESYVNIANARIEYAQREQGVTVQAQEYECAPDCPVRILGEQSGERKSGGRTKHIGEVTKNNHIYHAHTVASEFEMEPSTGTAARYFQQFAPDLWTQDMQDAEDVFIAEGGYEGEVPA